ncbi:hypothetical protein PG993_012861 [Apiospora rasikravindrae]|uniref:Uncharacterized protein n=1 Tax=Apiospora rasikravindrae TaxID=990691 RepID=A0ABR1RVZ6_9PEZI
MPRVLAWLRQVFQDFYHNSASLLLIAGTCSYNGALCHFTIEPIQEILEHQDDIDKVRGLLIKFHNLKRQELTFVERAALLASAAVIGVFSWPGTATSFWLCPTLWYSSLWLSIFALISSSQLRLIEQLPRTTEVANSLGNEDVYRLMLSVVRRDRNNETERTLEGNLPPCFKADAALTWVWQSPVMLMSYSWVLFLVGYLCYIVTPLIPRSWEATRPIIEI